jgi:hypothetical protein
MTRPDWPLRWEKCRGKRSRRMVRASARSRLLWWIAVATLAASVSAGLLSLGQRAEARAAEAELRAEERALPEGTEALPSLGGIEIVTPESGAKLRGLTLVGAEWPNVKGYVIFRVDDQFTYATTAPYEMRWDTSTALDAEHIVNADAYDASGQYVGSSSIKVVVENTVPAPEDGVLLMLKFREDELTARRVTAAGELSALASDEALPQGFDVIAGTLNCDLSQSVLDTRYEGVSALVRNRIRTGSLTVEGTRRGLPEVGQYSMVQVSPNGLAIPITAGTTRPRLGLGEISLALPDYAVFPGDTWEAPLGAVCSLYSRRAVFVPARHTFEGLRWFRGEECAVVTSSYNVPRVSLLTRQDQTVASAPLGAARSWELRLTGGGMMDRMGMGMGMRGERGERGGGMRAGAREGRRAGVGTQAAPRAGTARPGAERLDSAGLVNLRGTRRTYVAVQRGQVLHIEDSIIGKVEFRPGRAQTASAGPALPYSMQLTGGRRGDMDMQGMRAERGAGRGAASRARGGGATHRAAAGQRATPGAARAGAAGGGRIPRSLDYGLRLTSSLIAR